MKSLTLLCVVVLAGCAGSTEKPQKKKTPTEKLAAVMDKTESRLVEEKKSATGRRLLVLKHDLCNLRHQRRCLKAGKTPKQCGKPYCPKPPPPKNAVDALFE